LPSSGSSFLEGGPLLALPSGGAVAVATANADRPSLWRISPDGTPGPRKELPFTTFTPSVADVAPGGRWLLAGTRSDVPAPARVAVRRPSGAWRVSQRMPLGLVRIGGAWFDRAGRVNVIVTSARTSSVAGHPISELRLRRDGSWTTPRQIGKVTGTEVTVATNDDGDVAITYERRIDPRTLGQKLRVRPYGGSWSPTLSSARGWASIALDEAGTTSVVRNDDVITFGRVDPTGTVVDGWQQLTGPTFERTFGFVPNLTSSTDGVATVGVVGATPGSDGRIERYWRCLPGEDCVEIGDFDLGTDGFGHTLADGPDGTVHALSSLSPPCPAEQTLCSWRLAP
jgi:hypothetical protein